MIIPRNVARSDWNIYFIKNNNCYIWIRYANDCRIRLWIIIWSPCAQIHYRFCIEYQRSKTFDKPVCRTVEKGRISDPKGFFTGVSMSFHWARRKRKQSNLPSAVLDPNSAFFSVEHRHIAFLLVFVLVPRTVFGLSVFYVFENAYNIICGLRHRLIFCCTPLIERYVQLLYSALYVFDR
jgi:hypothetical protein